MKPFLIPWGHTTVTVVLMMPQTFWLASVQPGTFLWQMYLAMECMHCDKGLGMRKQTNCWSYCFCLTHNIPLASFTHLSLSNILMSYQITTQSPTAKHYLKETEIHKITGLSYLEELENKQQWNIQNTFWISAWRVQRKLYTHTNSTEQNWTGENIIWKVGLLERHRIYIWLDYREDFTQSGSVFDLDLETLIQLGWIYMVF